MTFTTMTTKARNDVGFLDVGNEEIEEIENNHIETYATIKPLYKKTETYEIEKTGKLNFLEIFITKNHNKISLECQKQHDIANSRLVKGGFVPQCTPNGDFEQLQCESDNQTCFCVNAEGIEIPNSRCMPGEPKPDCLSNI